MVEEKSGIYHRLFESSNAAILIISTNFHFVDCNEMAAKMLQRPKDEVIGCTPTDIRITPEFQPNGIPSSKMGPAKFKSAMKGNDLLFEWAHLKKDGTEFIVEVSLFGFLASNKQYFFAMWKGLTVVKKKENELRESEERFRSIFHQSADGILILQSDNKVVDCNKAALRQLQYKSKNEIIGKSPALFSPDVQPDGSKSNEKANEEIDKCLKNGQTQFEWIHTTKFGTPFWVDIVLTRINIKKEKFIHCLWRDISKMKKYQLELEKHQNHLEDLVEKRTKTMEEAIQELESFNYSVSHDLQAPLRAIIGFASLLEKKFSEKLDKTGKRYLKLIRESTLNMKQFMDDLLKLSRLSGTELRFKPIAMKELVTVIYEEITTIQEKKDFQFSVSDIPDAAGDYTYIRQVWTNLIENAIKYSAFSDLKKIEIGCIPDDNRIVYYIKDHGCGFDPAYKGKIFGVFQRLHSDSEYKGTGVGLAIVKRIIEKHNGEVWVDSKQDEGATFYFSLPKQKQG